MVSPSLSFILPLLAAPNLHASPPPPPPIDIISCLNSAHVPQSLPGTPSFASEIIPLNIRLNYTPSAYILPTTIPQIQSALSCANKYAIKVNPKSGGHSYASHSLGGENGHLVIDLKYFDDVDLDTVTWEAKVGPGTRLGNLAVHLFEKGGRAIAHGICPSVGVGGHVLHGGQGYSSHTYGLALDFLISADIVLANGSLVSTSQTQNPDLFWALRGAGMSYGLVTSFTFRTIAAPEENILFYYGYVWNGTQAFDGWLAFQNYCAGRTEPQIPREMNIRVFIGEYDGVDLLFLFEGAYHGILADFEVAIAPLLNTLNEIGGLDIVNAGVHEVGWLDSLLYANNNALYSNWDNGETLEVPFNYTTHANFFAKSLMTNDLTIAGVTAWINRLYDTGPSNSLGWYIIIAAQGGPTSIVPQIPHSSTSYAHRSQIFEWQLVAAVSNSETFPTQQGYDFLNPIIADIEAAESNVTFGMYYNYADPSLSAVEAHEKYWLGNYERLTRIKSEVDPGLLFMNPQTVNSV